MTVGKGKPIFEVVLPLGLPFKVAPDWRYLAPHKQRGKDRNTQRPLHKHKSLGGSLYSGIIAT